MDGSNGAAAARPTLRAILQVAIRAAASAEAAAAAQRERMALHSDWAAGDAAAREAKQARRAALLRLREEVEAFNRRGPLAQPLRACLACLHAQLSGGALLARLHRTQCTLHQH